MSWLMWTVVAGLLVALVALHFVGARALENWGVRPSRGVLALRALNVTAAIAVVAFAFWRWAG